ncbi:MAG: recombinase family protein [Bdellovibrionota bacterium]
MRLNIDIHTKRKRKNLREGYAITRVSTSERARTQHGSLEQQWNRISRWEESITRETGIHYKVIQHIEEDTSGKRENTHRRLELLELSRRIESGLVDFIVVEKLDRLSRDEIFNLILAEKLVKYGVELFLIDGGKVDFRQPGDRWKFKIDNIRAGEYSEDLSQKVSIKQREAMVNNGKDPTPIPTLGFDKHKVWVGMYEVNEKELNIVMDIMKKLGELNGSRIGTLEYCKRMSYLTKSWLTESKVNKEGRRIPPKKMGGIDFTWDSLMRLLKNPKYRGINKFYDYYGQFPDRQDEHGFVTWEYFHKREYGQLIDSELLSQVDELVETIEWKPRQNSFYLAGVIFDPKGSRYYGEAAKKGKNCYYYNRKTGHRIIADEIHSLLAQKLKGLLQKNEKFENLLKAAKVQREIGLQKFEEEKCYLRDRLEELLQVEARFTESVRSLALAGTANLEKAINVLIEEKESAENEVKVIQAQLTEVEKNELEFVKSYQGHGLKRFLSTAYRDFDKMHDIEKKTLFQAVFPRITVHVKDEGVDLEIVTSLDPFQTSPTASPHRGREDSNATILSFSQNLNQKLDQNSVPTNKKSHLCSSSKPVRVEEDTKWPSIKNGRTDWI